MRHGHVLALIASTSLAFLACEAPPTPGETESDGQEARAQAKPDKAPPKKNPPPASDAGAPADAKKPTPKPPGDVPPPPPKTDPKTPPPGPSCTWLTFPFKSCFREDPKNFGVTTCTQMGLEFNRVEFGPACADGGFSSLMIECCKPLDLPPSPPPPPPPPTKCEARTTDACADRDTLWDQTREDCTNSKMEIMSISFVACGQGGVNATYTCCPAASPTPPACQEETIAHLDRCTSLADLRAEAAGRCKAQGRTLEGDLAPGDMCGKGGATWAVARCCLH